MVPSESVARWPLPAAGVERETLPTGGHVGFVGPTAAPGRFWAAERAMAFLSGHTGDDTATAIGGAEPDRGSRR
jgi:predicted alpha/beta-fold hydrolase